MHKELHKTGLALSNEVYAMDSSDMVALVSGEVPGKPAERHKLLRMVLSAELAPGVTIEDASHANIDFLADEELPPARKVREDLALLFDAGLAHVAAANGLPDAIVVIDSEKFQAKLPHLTKALPMLIFGKGVQPYTKGLPRVDKPGLLRVK
ncbi:hypothetical protein [Novimethylophilus kurashikiensis]|nr:hypothetical protein [Novimethylophilus kurashikiensis]